MGDHVADQAVFPQEDLVTDHAVLDWLAAAPKGGQRGGCGTGRDAGERLQARVFQHCLPVRQGIVVCPGQVVFRKEVQPQAIHHDQNDVLVFRSKALGQGGSQRRAPGQRAAQPTVDAGGQVGDG
jgi:hypothetical protein